MYYYYYYYFCVILLLLSVCTLQDWNVLLDEFSKLEFCLQHNETQPKTISTTATTTSPCNSTLSLTTTTLSEDLLEEIDASLHNTSVAISLSLRAHSLSHVDAHFGMTHLFSKFKTSDLGLEGIMQGIKQIMHSGKCVGTMWRTLRCAINITNFTLHYLFYKIGLNFHSPQDLILENVRQYIYNTSYSMHSILIRLLPRKILEVVIQFASCSTKIA